MIHAVQLPRNAPPDQKMAMLSVGGAYAPQPSLADRTGPGMTAEDDR